VIGTASGASGTLPIRMSSDEDVQGFVLSGGFDASKLAVDDVRAAGVTVAQGAELIVGEILTGGFTLGVVMDFNPPYAGQVIGDGNDQLIAEADVASDLVLPCGDSELVAVNFQNGLNSPPLSNILVVGGQSIGVDENLVMTGGGLTVPGACDTIKVASATGAAGAETVTAEIQVDNNVPVEGYVLSFQFQDGPTLQDVTTAGTDAAAVGIEFEVIKEYATGATVGVVFDFDPPYDGQFLDIGSDQSLAKLVFFKAAFLCPDRDTVVTENYAIDLADNIFGTPPLANILVEGGQSISPDLVDGSVTFTCKKPDIPPPEGIDFYAGATCGEPEFDPICCAVGSAGAEVAVGFYYTSATEPIQGISMAVEFDLPLEVSDLMANGQGLVGDRHLAGTVTKGIGAEFVAFNADNVTGELVIGILVDSTPPIPINHMYPPRLPPNYGKVIDIYFKIPATAECETSYSVKFVNPVYGAGEVPIYNRASVFNESRAVTLHNEVGVCVVVGGKAAFIRGDCNTDQMVDIADPAATMSYLFLGVYDPACLDACDSNDDGVVDLADVASTLRFLFKLGPILPLPGPYPPGGYDPTPDIYGLDLGCEAGDPCND
jgi:hypothetical protein